MDTINYYFTTVSQTMSSAIKHVADDNLSFFQKDVFCMFVSKATQYLSGKM